MLINLIKNFSIIIILFVFNSINKLNSYEKTFIIVSEIFPPYTMYDSNNNLTGFNIDISKLICEKIQIKCKFIELNTKEIFASINAGISDFGVGLFKTDQREKNFLFSNKYHENSIGILKYKSNNNIKKIGVIIGAVESLYVQKYFKEDQIIFFDNTMLKFQAFKSKNIDAMTEYFDVINSYLEKNESLKQEIIFEKINNIEYDTSSRFMSKKNNNIFIKKINIAIEELKESNSIDKLKEKYNLK